MSDSGTVQETPEFLPFKMTTLTAKMEQKAKDELGETEEKLQESLKVLRDFIIEEKLPLPKDDKFLLMFLRGKSFKTNDVQEMLRNYVSLQRKAYKYHMSGDFSRIRKVLENNVCGVLPFRDEEGRIILFFRSSAWDPKNADAKDFIMSINIITYLGFQYPATTICGLRMIMDASVKSKDDVVFHAKNLQNVISNLKGFPARFHQVDIINENDVTRVFIKMFRKIFPTNVLGKIHAHGTDLESLVRNFHPSILPEEFGGTLGPLSCESYIEDVNDCIEEFKKKCAGLY